MNPFQFLWRHRHLILHTTHSDIRARYSGSMLGLAWALLNPLMLLSVYVARYVFILRVRLPAGRPGMSVVVSINTKSSTGQATGQAMAEAASGRVR